jgi:hypothetical protein
VTQVTFVYIRKKYLLDRQIAMYTPLAKPDQKKASFLGGAIQPWARLQPFLMLLGAVVAGRVWINQDGRLAGIGFWGSCI